MCNRPLSLLGSLTVTLWLGCSASAAGQSPVQIRTDDPRPFGYVVGDVLQRSFHIDSARPWVIAPDSLPGTGRIDQWLELRGAKLEAHSDARTNSYDVTVAYQLVNSPESARVLALPRVALRFRSGAESLTQEVPELLFTATPVTVHDATSDSSLGEMRPDNPPSPIPTRFLAARLSVYGAGIATILLYFAYVRLGSPLIARRNLPFARAHRELRRLRKRPADEARLRSALRLVHRAFDETADTALFAEELDAFFAHNTRFAALREPAEQFFRCSRQEFFEGGAGREALSLERLVSLCKQGRALERHAA
jgi:mxaA protein